METSLSVTSIDRGLLALAEPNDDASTQQSFMTNNAVDFAPCKPTPSYYADLDQGFTPVFDGRGAEQALEDIQEPVQQNCDSDVQYLGQCQLQEPLRYRARRDSVQQHYYDPEQYSDNPVPPNRLLLSPRAPEVVPAQQPAEDYSQITALRSAILAIAPMLYAARFLACRFSVVTGRKEPTQSRPGRITAALIAFDEPDCRRWVKLAGGIEYYDSYQHALQSVLQYLEDTVGQMLSVREHKKIHAHAWAWSNGNLI
ncbi:hypothetical protein EK21DRAFT_109917 [Setomelanomma holmii]|uniref:Uncharacterized protein n=1 Tax=Setomelanomma holmii TaxID=210430 RepID=A0A9P4HDH1_9PLEO|nr:hypothetical protein EK21DRAFT_109917 [Setomelanomma holmii]